MDYLDKSYQSEGFKTNDDLSSWEKCYWYLRLLVETSRYGALAKDTKRLTKIYNELMSTFRLIQKDDNSEQEKTEILANILTDSLFENVKEGSKKDITTTALLLQLQQFLLEPKDFFIFALTIKELLLPTNDAIANVPTTESTDFARKYGKAVLDTKKEQGLASLIRDWDNFTEALSLNKERDLIVGLFKSIRKNLTTELTKFSESIDNEELDIVFSAICQEYERRVGQKRKQRAGNDLESVTEFVFNYFGIKTAGSPEHFSTGLEVDNWIKDKNGWYIGISLKRTLRERWKQTYTTEIGFLDRHKIKYIIHILNNDMDLSDSKITELGSYRHLFFMADTSSTLSKLKDHVAMGKYVFPMSSLIEKIKEFMK